MRPRDSFILAVRIVGLVCLLASLAFVLSAVLALVAEKPSYASSASVYFVTAFFWLVVAGYLLRGAPGVVRFAFRDDDE